MKRLTICLFTILAFCNSFAQINKIYYEKDLGWANWVFTSIEFYEDYTIVKGYFVPGKGGCWTRSDGEEKLVVENKEYSVLESTLFAFEKLFAPTYKENDTIYFEDKFQPIVNPASTVTYSSNSINFSIQNLKLNVQPTVRNRFACYKTRMIYWNSNQYGSRIFNRYLGYCAKEIQSMTSDSASIAREMLKECYNIHTFLGKSNFSNIRENIDYIKEIHYGLTGFHLSNEEEEYLTSIANFVYKVQWNEDLNNTDSLALLSLNIDYCFKEEDRGTSLYNIVTKCFESKKNDSSIILPTNIVENAYEKYDKGDYKAAIDSWPYSIYIQYKVLSEKQFIHYCDSTYKNCSLELTNCINSPYLFDFLVTANNFYSDSWNFLYLKGLQEDLPYFARLTQNGDIIKNTLNGIILAKNYKLYAENYLRDKLSDRKDSLGVKLYEDIQKEQSVLEAMYQNNLRDESVYKKKRTIIDLKIKLSEHLKLAKINVERFVVSWDNLKTYLKNDEIAIEFQEFPIWRSDSVCCIALTYTNKSIIPKLYTIYACKKDSISSIKEKDIPKLSKQIWEVLELELKDVKTVYFSPSGILYKYPIEYFTPADKNFIRLSSTREIAINTKDKFSADKPMILYGGLKYNMTRDDLAEANEKYKHTENEHNTMYAIRSSRDVIKRIGFEYLEGTLEEVRTIETIAEANNYKCELFIDEKGTEESLRTINDKRCGLLHFATHGFYWTEDEAEDHASEKRLSFLMMDTGQPRKYHEDKAMTRSGLIFSGANLALRGKELPEGMEDGIATAQEISHLNLRGCDLVVLSACQTGLGEVSGEGVFGLQRGFKKAGVNSILMSLWEVDDRATQMLMVEFYKHYLAGDTKLQSLRKAQQYVKSQPNFESPEFWAGFILLDGIN